MFYWYNPNKPKTEVLPPYVVGHLTADGELDWARINVTLADFSRSEEEQIYMEKDLLIAGFFSQ